MSQGDLRPVSAALEGELGRELRRHGVVVWLDRDGVYTQWVERAAERAARGELAYPVVGFRGSFLEMMLALEDHGSGLDPGQLLVHMPGFAEDSIRTTPVLELYRAGSRFRRALETLVREAAAGVAPPEAVERFLAGDDVSLESADRWLAGWMRGGTSGLAELLERIGVAVVAHELVVESTFLRESIGSGEAGGVDELRAFLERTLGIEAWWVELVSHGQGPDVGEIELLADAVRSWLLCVEFVDDLTRPPHLEALQPLSKLPRTTVTTCRELVAGVREHHPDRYERIADEVEPHVDEELQRIEPKDLGRIDTFRTEEARILVAAVRALQRGDWQSAGEWAADRLGERSFWLRRDPQRRQAWELVAAAAELGRQIAEQPRPLDGARGLEDALERYTGGAYMVDRAHRRFEELRQKRLRPQLPHFVELKEVVGPLRRSYREWADRLACDFTAVCRRHGVLPDSSLLQRSFFERDVMPIADGPERVAVLLVDALRYEMATELLSELGEAGLEVRLRARLAELPTVTEVGMNALAPVSRAGTLQLAGSAGLGGFASGEFAVHDPSTRARAMGQRSTGQDALSVNAAEITDAPEDRLNKRIQQKRLVVVHLGEIDTSGEAGVGLDVFADALSRVVSVCRRLESAGVTRFVIAADHGFLLVDETVGVRPYGKRTDPKPRYVLASERRDEDGVLAVSFAELGYAGRDGWLLFPEDTSVFDRGGARPGFVHGGNSPQERIVPVLIGQAKRRANVDWSAYRVEATVGEDLLGHHRLHVRIVHDAESGALPLTPSEPVSLALRAVERPDVRGSVVDVVGPGHERGGRLYLTVEAEACEVVFGLSGASEAPAQVELYHPDGSVQVAPARLERWFAVEAVRSAERSETSASGASADEPRMPQWAEALEDEGERRVFLHLDEHGSITEEEATRILGSPRRLRQFSRRFETLLERTPLRVRIEMTGSGKRYVREGRSG